MDQVKTGRLIRTMRTKLGLTQLALAEQLGVSDKAVSKWERGGGAPDISLLPLLSQALGVDTEALLRGDLEENDMTNGNMKKMRFYRCPAPAAPAGIRLRYGRSYRQPPWCAVCRIQGVRSRQP